MMSLGLDFVLPSCPGIPDSVLITTSSIMGKIPKRCWLLLGTFIAIQLLVDAIFDVSQGQFTLITYGRTLLYTFFVVSFLTYYKPLLMFFNTFIEHFYDVEKLVLTTALEQGKDRFLNYLKDPLWLSSLVTFVKAMFETFPKMISFLTHTGALHHLKAVTLLVITPVVSLAALFSLLPGPFKREWAVWAHSYIYVTCWMITLNIFRILVKDFTPVSLLTEPRGLSTFFSETVGHPLLYLMLLIAIFLTPSWTSKFIGPTYPQPK